MTLVHELRWPIAVVALVVFVVLYFRKEITDVIKRLTKLGVSYEKEGEFKVTVSADVDPCPEPTLETTKDTVDETPEPAEEPIATPTAQPGLESLSADAVWVLATLWHYQVVHHSANSNERWTFLAGPGSGNWTRFLDGIAELRSRRLSKLAPDSGQAYLTDLGMEFCRRNDDDLNERDRFDFH